jgi:hypothetical protein
VVGRGVGNSTHPFVCGKMSGIEGVTIYWVKALKLPMLLKTFVHTSYILWMNYNFNIRRNWSLGLGR